MEDGRPECKHTHADFLRLGVARHELDHLECLDCGRWASSAFHMAKQAVSSAPLPSAAPDFAAPPRAMYTRDLLEVTPRDAASVAADLAALLDIKPKQLSSFSQSNYPKFKDPRNRDMSDPRLFLRELNRTFFRS